MTETLKEGGAYRVGYEIYDGLLRLRQTQQPAPTGGRVRTDMFYDSRGMVWKKNAPHWDTAAPSGDLLERPDNEVPSQFTFKYDPMGRPTSETFHVMGKAKWSTTTAYGGDRVTLDAPDGGTSITRITDAAGRLTQVWQYRGDSPTGDKDVTSYGYDRFGRLAQVQDAEGNAWKYRYDLRGRLVETDDPDKGTTVWSSPPTPAAPS